MSEDVSPQNMNFTTGKESADTKHIYTMPYRQTALKTLHVMSHKYTLHIGDIL